MFFGGNHSILYTSVNNVFAFRVSTARTSRLLAMDLLESRQIFNMYFSGAGTIELAQEDALPGPENEITMFYQDDHARSKKASFKMTCAVPFTMLVVRLSSWNEPF